MKHLLRSVVALALGFATAAAADTITIRYDNPVYTPLGYDGVNLSRNSGGSWTGVNAGRFQATVLGVTGTTTVGDLVDNASDLVTYCYDLLQYISHGESVTYTINPAGPRARTLDYLGAVNYVLNGNSNTWLDSNAWLHPAGAQATNIAAAIQIGIWESLYDNSGWDLSSGLFRANGLDAGTTSYWNLFSAATLNPLVANLGPAGAMTIESPSHQDQIIGGREPPHLDIPEPASMALVGLALLLTLRAGRRADQT